MKNPTLEQLTQSNPKRLLLKDGNTSNYKQCVISSIVYRQDEPYDIKIMSIDNGGCVSYNSIKDKTEVLPMFRSWSSIIEVIKYKDTQFNPFKKLIEKISMLHIDKIENPVHVFSSLYSIKWYHGDEMRSMHCYNGDLELFVNEKRKPLHYRTSMEAFCLLSKWGFNTLNLNCLYYEE